MHTLSQDEFSVFQQNGAPAQPEHNTVAFLEQERREGRVIVKALVSVFPVQISNTNCDNFEPICHDN